MAKPYPLNKWKNAAGIAVGKASYAAAYRRAQRIKLRVETAIQPFFSDLVAAGIGVSDAPSLGEFTPNWQPLTDKWIRYKAKRGKSTGFFSFGGSLRAALSRRRTAATFGNVQVELVYGPITTQVTVRPPAKKYRGLPQYKARINVRAFPRVDVNKAIDLQIFSLDENERNLTLAKLLNRGYGGTRLQRQLLTPFTRWYLKYRVKQAIRNR